MSALRILSGYDTDRIPAQGAFRRSPARVRGFGGAMGGGKSFALCQEAWDYALDYPGILLPVFRSTHVSITNTTRKTFYEQVLPAELRGRKDLIRVKQSGGEDFCELLWNGSQIHFVGLDDPGRWFSAEIGAAFFDEAHQIAEKDVLTLNSRLRQRCIPCVKAGIADCKHMPHTLALTFNPSYPGHWLQVWFVLGSERTEFGFHKKALIATDADFPIGDAEFFIARAADNPFLPPGYIDQALGGLSTMQRRRYLDGLWEHVDGSGFFDQDALAALTTAALETQPLLVGEPQGDVTGQPNKPSLVERRTGRLECWKAPVRWHVDSNGDEVKAHRYVVAIDASSGASADYSAIQVISVEDLEQVAEWQGKVDPDKLAEAAFLIGAVYNGALLVPEITGGFGFSVAKRLQALMGKWEGPVDSKPRIYTRPVRDRLSQRWTDLIGWDTQTKSRAEMLDSLEESIRDGSLEVHGQRTLAELAAFAFGSPSQTTGEYRSPRARQGAHDDLVVALAIGVTVALRLPRQLRRGTYTSRPQERPEFSATGF
jgi:hypothetical protein